MYYGLTDKGTIMTDSVIQLACGAEAIFDEDTGIGYRCTTCFAMVGSIAMPSECAELEEDAEIARKARSILKGEKVYV